MLSRCYDPKNDSYPYYGGRIGKPPITVCDRWRESFVNYNTDILALLGPKPSPEHTIDRIDYNGNYEPSNVRWATQKEQANNKSNNVFLTYNEQIKTLTEWAKSLNMPVTTIHSRLDSGWSVEEALSTPISSPIPKKIFTVD
jgi:hypothetical protein